MNHKVLRFFKCASLLSVLALTFCAQNNGYQGEDPVYDDVFEDDYTYMWHQDGIIDEQDRMIFQSINYSALVDSKTGKLLSYAPYLENNLDSIDISLLNNVEMKYQLRVEEAYYDAADIAPSGRIIASGRHFNKWDNISLRFKGQGAKYYGRTEYVATKNYMALNYELIAEVPGSYGLKYTIAVENYSINSVENGVKAIDANGNGFYFISNEKNVSISSNNNNVITAEYNVDATNEEFKGFSAFIIPIKENSNALLENFNSFKYISIIAKDKKDNLLPVSYDDKRGLFIVDIHEISSGGPAVDGAYDAVDFEINNSSSIDSQPIVVFEKDSNGSITGVSGVIRDSESLEPTGEQVQMSKNWHRFQNLTDSLIDKAKVNNQGVWCSGIVSIDCKANETTKRQYLQVYGRWGSAYAVSHDQLCLIGWGGNQLWDESALGSWGESVTYDPDINLSRAIINDVRPFLVTAPTGGNNQFNWSGNVGGADFLNYREKFDEKIVSHRVSYKTQGPNVTDVLYSGVTSDHKIKTNININLGRTDDIVRNFYTIEYTFLEDVNYTRLSLFKMGADNYNDNSFTNYCYGDIEGLIVSDRDCLLSDVGYLGDPIDIQHSDFFFGTYNSSNAEEHGDPMFCVREFDAKINSKSYDKPAYQFFGTTDTISQVSCELTVPTSVGKTIKRGSKISLTIEFSILPNNMTTYYGSSDYILLSNSLMGKGEAMYQQVYGGKVSVKAAKGNVIANNPVIVECENDECEFSVTGGLGYVPLIIENVSDYKGYSLEQKINGAWVKVDQSIIGNDYYQVVYNAKTGKYQFAYNIKNTKGLNFLMEETYRFVKTGN